jgi:dCMP deaminase
MSSTKKLFFGLTGSFGSGCSTFSNVLRDVFDFKVISLSGILREKWIEENPKKDPSAQPRSVLQDFGDKLRLDNGTDYLAKEAYNKLRGLGLYTNDAVFDSIRNLDEVIYLRNNLPEFYLIAVDSEKEDRWNRVSSLYKGDKVSFEQDDTRDKNEPGISHGQQVELCVDNADILIRNDNDNMLINDVSMKEKIYNKLDYYIQTIRNSNRRPNEEETYMSIAYSASLMSTCFKRQVGAVIVEKKNGKIISVGYNENPLPLTGCVEIFGDCYREIYIDSTMKKIKHCPSCGIKLEDFKYPYQCTNCKINIYRYVIPDRAMSRCPALHAEEMAIFNAGSQDLSNSTMYVTAFPCFSCAYKIINAKINEVCYVDSYPDIDSLGLFKKAQADGYEVAITNFEGVKAKAFFKIFSQWRSQEEKRLEQKRYPPAKN